MPYPKSSTNHTANVIPAFMRWLALGAVMVLAIAAETMAAPKPNMDAIGNGIIIADADTTPDVADDTDFGSVDVAGGTVTHTFTIENTGGGDLVLSGTPTVALTTGTDFTVTTQPALTTLTSGQQTTFDIQFDPTTTGLRSDSVSILTNVVGSKADYTFAIQGTGTSAATPPTVANPSIAAIQNTTATLGGEVTDIGSDNVTERGIYWSTTSGFTPPGEGTKVSTTGTWSAPFVFTENVTGLTESALIYFQAFATNSAGDTYTTEDSLQTEPSVQAASIVFSSVTSDSMTISWTANDAVIDGSIVVVREGGAVPVGSLPVDGTLHADGSGVFGSGNDLGGLSYVVYLGAGETVNVTNLQANTTYFVKVFSYAGSGTDPYAGINYQQDAPPENSQLTAGAGPSPPTVTNTTIATVTDTTATLGGEVTVIESPPVTERGVYWSTTPGFTPPGQGTKVSTTGSFGLGTFTQAVDTLPQATRVYFKAFAVDGVGEGYSIQDDFWTEPTGQASAITFPVVEATNMTVSWTAGSGHGALVVMKEGTAVPVTSLPVDGTEHSDGSNVFGAGDNLGDLSYVVYRGSANSVAVTGLTAETTYWVKVFEYAGGSGDGINYQQDAPPEASQDTAVGVPATSHNAIRNIQCDQCHAMHGSSTVPRGAAQEAVCVYCHNATDMAGKPEKWDVSMHIVNEGTTTIDCGSCHAVHAYPFETDNTSHGGVVAENILRIRWDAWKYVPGAGGPTGDEPAIFQERPGHYAFGETAFPSGPYNGICQSCHQNNIYHTNDGWNDSAGAAANNDHEIGSDCTTCHGHTDGFQPSGCTGCHGAIADNTDGAPTRRAILGEFSLTSHHVDGATMTDGDCKVCHYEAVDTQNYHMNNLVDLRNPDTGSPITAFTKFTRNRSSDLRESWITDVQDFLCLKCHDLDGATATANTDDGGTALRPFSANTRDVPAVYERFDPANTFHHAVRAAGANNFCVPSVENGSNITLEPPWNQDATHDMITCFDCHGDVVTDPDGTSNLVSAHGSANQRMLRTPIDLDGLEAAGVAQDLGLVPASVGTDTRTFCTLCHKAAVYVETRYPGSLGSIFEHHGDSQSQHSASGGNELGCMGCHGGIVDFGPPAADNGARRGNLHGDSFIWGTGSFTEGVATEHFMLGGWNSGWEMDATTGYCRGGDCNHETSSQDYTLTNDP